MTDSDLFAPPSPPTSVTRGIVLCEFDQLIVGIPQQDVVTIEHGSSLAAPLAGERTIGWFESDSGPWPVYALDRELRPVESVELQRAFLVFIKNEGAPIGLLCESVRIIGRADELALQPLPEPLASFAPLETRIAPIHDRIAVILASGQILAHIQKLEGAELADTVIRKFNRSKEVSTDGSCLARESVRAWLLEWPLQPLALALCEVIEIVSEPRIHRLPFGPVWCRAVLRWRERFIALAAGEASAHIVVTAYQVRAGEELQFAAFGTTEPPRQITVVDGLDCETPRTVFGESQLRASFAFEGRALVVPELASLFAREGVRT